MPENRSSEPLAADAAPVPDPLAPAAAPSTPPAADASAPVAKEIGGRDGPDPTRYGDWEKNGRCIDF